MKINSLAQRGLKIGAATTMLAVVGVAVLTGPASAHSNAVTGTVTCHATQESADYSIQWVVANDYNLSENTTVTAATGGLRTVTPASAAIAASPALPYATAEFVQILPGTTSGASSLTVQGLWSDRFTTSDSGTVPLPGNCVPLAPPPTAQTISGQIYLCVTGTASTTEVAGGTLGATGAEDVATGANPLALLNVAAGTYTMSATPTAGYELVSCGGKAVVASSGRSATVGVNVPSGGTGAGIFYVQLTASTAPGAAGASTPTTPTTVPTPAPTVAPPTVAPLTVAPLTVAASTVAPATVAAASTAVVPTTHTGEAWSGWPYWMIVALLGAAGVAVTLDVIRRRRLARRLQS